MERLYRKQRLAAAYRLFGRNGFHMGGAGHITARDPLPCAARASCSPKIAARGPT